jgi:hypothetical protein
MQGTGSFRLIVRRGPQPNQIYELNKDSITIGRDITNDIVINDPEVSRHHCTFVRGPGGYTLEDKASTNGTFVNGQRLTTPRPLMSSDMIGLGETVTLGYESSLMPQMPASGDPVSGTMIGQRPQPPGYGAPQPYPQAQPVAQQPQPQGGYGAPPPPPQYDNFPPPEQAGGSSAARWLFLGCGCLVLLCIVAAIVAVFVIDSQNLYCKLPIVRNIVNIISTCPPVP